MRVVEVATTFPGSVHEAESLWYDTDRWAAWVVGLAHVQSVSGAWPGVGAEVRWRSSPAGRGSVVERVTEYQRLEGQTLEIEDDSIRGRQRITFAPDGDRVAVRLSLVYELKRRSLPMALVDVLFIRRAMLATLEETLSRFGGELQAVRGPGVG